MEKAKKAFTLVELLTVLAIIAMLIALIAPASFTIRRFAKETKQKAQLNTIGLALVVFRDDYGDYPPSYEFGDYCGSQKLTEALLGRDLLGFHPQSNWDGIDNTFYNTDTLYERKGRYLEDGSANAFKLDDLFSITPFAPDTFVICDVFGTKEVVLPNGKKVKAGTPLLYYRANVSSKIISEREELGWKLNIYNYGDNRRLVFAVSQETNTDQPLDSLDYFYDDYIVDSKLEFLWPHNPDSYLLISAGKDGIYGTADDITNF